MPTQIQLRRGTYTQHQSFTGANAEPTFDTSNRVMRIHDGTTPGGLEQVAGNTLYKSTPVRVVATSNITLSAPQTIDGVSAVVGDRVLVVGQTDAGARIDRQERRIGLRPLLAQRRQHDLHRRVEALQHLQQRRIELARRVALRRRHELVFEAERVEERAQARIVMLAE